MPDIQARLDFIADRLAHLSQRIDRLRTTFVQSEAGADLQEIGADLDRLVGDVRAALDAYRNPQPPATEAD